MARTHAITTTTATRLLSRPAPLTTLLTLLTVGLASWLKVTHQIPDQTLWGLRQFLLSTGGALFFGAGLLRLVTWRMDHEPRRASRGWALGVGGLTVALFSPLVMAWSDGLPIAFDPLIWGLCLAVLWATASTIVFTFSFITFWEAAAAKADRLSSAELALSAAARAAISLEQHQRLRRHDARNALCVVRMATQTLADVGDRLDVQTRERLREAVLEEVGVLDELISRATTAEVDVLGIAKETAPLHSLAGAPGFTEAEPAVTCR